MLLSLFLSLLWAAKCAISAFHGTLPVGLVLHPASFLHQRHLQLQRRLSADFSALYHRESVQYGDERQLRALPDEKAELAPDLAPDANRYTDAKLKANWADGYLRMDAYLRQRVEEKTRDRDLYEAQLAQLNKEMAATRAEGRLPSLSDTEKEKRLLKLIDSCDAQIINVDDKQQAEVQKLTSEAQLNAAETNLIYFVSAVIMVAVLAYANHVLRVL
ncbi:unnamed protein product [Vitrella brassicaformis CCMP3155]|uniref:Transmembrane protein n=1 Tax=Vitrella brassicaformis (strain CCMP3155) TaxID=1169540 RepID=A0A0G4E8N5_VITBC|nr:unnamed protein product [Vitrella brassicaformis CCMP3155]|eukprot:CEL91877.1 unnamed protein product [Vitrella brassicaformis CCMP3155]